jgi:hypothetical protein
MPKTHGTTDLAAYALVADRITLFHETYPSGQILTDLISRENGEITFRARIYREPGDRRPSATGWASEVIGDGEINEVACLENTETSAVGRALANLGFTASKARPSAEEMLKVARARARLDALRRPSKPTVVREPEPVSYTHARETLIADALFLVNELERLAFAPDKLREAREALARAEIGPAKIEKIERTLRRWLQEHRQLGSNQPQQ